MLQPEPSTIHATSVAIGGRGVLILGPSGAGKSDLALRLIDRGAILISDDYTMLEARDGRLLASPPETIAGKLEIRHIGIVNIDYAMLVPVALAVRLEESPPRMPDRPATLDLCGIAVPLVILSGREPSAPIKAEHALALFGPDDCAP